MPGFPPLSLSAERRPNLRKLLPMELIPLNETNLPSCLLKQMKRLLQAEASYRIACKLYHSDYSASCKQDNIPLN